MFAKKSLSALLLTIPSALFALQIEVGGGPQQEQFRGWVKYKGNEVDLKSDLHIEDKTKGFGYIDIRHKASLGFIPLPDVRISYLDVKSSGYGKVSKTFTFGAITINATDNVYSKFQFHQWDTTFYYTPVRSEFFKATWGFGVKVIDFKGYVRSQTTGQSDSKSATIPLPYLYGRLGVNYWLLHAYAEGRGITAGGNNYFYDIGGAVGIGYNFNKNFNVSLDGGYRYQKYRVDDVDDVSANTRIKGGFGKLSLNIAF